MMGDDAVVTQLLGQENLGRANVNAHKDSPDVPPRHEDLGVGGSLLLTSHLQGDCHEALRVHGTLMEVPGQKDAGPV